LLKTFDKQYPVGLIASPSLSTTSLDSTASPKQLYDSSPSSSSVLHCRTRSSCPTLQLSELSPSVSPWKMCRTSALQLMDTNVNRLMKLRYEQVRKSPLTK